MRFRKAFPGLAVLAALAGCSSGTLGERPSVTTISAGDGADLISITLTVEDEDLTRCDVVIEFLRDGEMVWQPATIVSSSAGRVVGNSVTGLRPAAGGTTYVLVWDSWIDGVARAGAAVNVTLRATPKDIDGTGEAVESAQFSVDNTIAVLNILDDAVDFTYGWGNGTNPADQNVTAIENTGSATLNWATSVNYTLGAPGWLSVPANGTTAPFNGTSDVNFSVTPVEAALEPGVHVAVVSIDDPDARDAPQDITVTLTVSPPVMEVTPAALDFVGVIGYGAPVDQAFDVANTAVGTGLNWEVDTGDAAWPTWLTVNGASTGSVAGGAANTVTLSVDHANPDVLEAGVYSYTLTVRDSEEPHVATITSDRVTVTLTVRYPRPDIELNAGASINVTCVQGQPLGGPEAFTVKNVGDVGSELTWTAGTPSETWLTVAPTTNAAGPLAKDASESVDATINTAAMVAGPVGTEDEYTATVVFAGEGAGGEPTLTGDKTLTVYVDMLVPPQLDLDPAGVSFPDAIYSVSYPAAAEVVTLTNSGEVDLDWSADWLGGTDPLWVDVSPAFPASDTGVAPGGEQDFTFTVDPAGPLAAGDYSATVVFENQFGDTQSLTLTLTVKQQGELATSPASFDITASEGGANPADRTLSIWNSNADKALMNWSISTAGKPAWLTLSSTSGSCTTETDEVTLSVDITGLAEGYNQTWTLTVSSVDGTGGPVDIPVSLTITPPCIWVDATYGTAAGPGTEAAPFKTISQAMSVAVAGDTVVVKPGTYAEHVTIPANDISLLSQYGPGVTTIDGGGTGIVVDLNTYDGVTVEGFQISGAQYGIDAVSSYDVTVRRCRFENLWSTQVLATFADGFVIIEGNEFHNGVFSGSGQASCVDLRYVSATGPVRVINNLFVDSDMYDPVIWAWDPCPDLIIANNTIVGGYAGIQLLTGCASYVISNNIIVDCTYGIYSSMGILPILTCNDVYNCSTARYSGIADQTGLNGNISVDPLFLETGAYPYYLNSFSPCVEGGDNTAVELPATDILGQDRIYSSLVDTGCYEWTPAGPPPLNHFDFGTISGTKYVGVPFPVTITAKTAAEATATDFDGVVLLGALGSGPGTKTIGTGTSTWSYPMHTSWHDSRTQVIYLASELGGPMTITSLALYVTIPPGQTMNFWTIRMKHTTLASYPATPSWESTGWTTVHSSNANVGTTNNWVTFNFSQAFAYNGTSNLMIDYSHNNTTYTSPGYCQYTGFSPSYRSIYYYTDSGYGDNPLLWSGTSNPTPVRYTYVPNIQLGGTMSVPKGTNPAVAGPFVGGVWSGDVSVLTSGSGVKLTADDGNGHTGQSNTFTVNP